MTGNEPWMADSACGGLPVSFFYPEREGPGGIRAEQWEEGRKVCDACPVRLDCLRYALRERETWGLWGCLTPRERAKISKGLAPMPA